MNPNEISHTPGPWKFTDVKQSDGGHLLVVGTEAANVNGFAPSYARSVATMTGKAYHNENTSHFDRENFEVSKANARLIAAAPELLSALKWVESAYDQRASDEELSEAFKCARAAIAKAELRDEQI